ncbi:hypothetical protein RHGRI_006177 [Rhododendron griersonianum]|uniref:Retrotransposon Copia-like N-terminal domain-containing protein n=1 Tax=Rhododendron griersonianum TaxID=479676 RepID=A0AAV6LFX9_9ERIC|nr:hypothetical protein RHGRI_006177 [Rhododendron griersonianum]
MVQPSDVVEHGGNSTDSILEGLTTRMAEVLTKNQTQIHTPSYESSAAPISIKLDGTNYALWSQVLEMYISGKDKLGYINGDIQQPQSTDPTFRKWRTENAVVKGWLIKSMDPALISNFIRFPTAKMKYNSIQQEDRVYIFLDGLDDRLDKIRSDVLQLQPFPMVEQAYAHVRREDIRQTVMITGTETTTGAVMASRGIKMGQQQSLSLQMPKNGSSSTSSGSHFTNSKAKVQPEGGGCTHCKNPKHTRETCFKLHGYPEWWNELKARKHREATSNEGSGRAALVNAEPQLSFISQEEPSNDSTTLNDQGNCGYALLSSNQNDYNGWIIDSGATDHMTFNSNEFIQITQPRRTSIANANGVTYPVTGAGTVALSPSLSLSNTLLDILTKEIIGRGTKRGGLYYMDDFSPENKVVSEEKKADADVSQGVESESYEYESETEPPHSSVPEDPSPENIPETKSWQATNSVLSRF